METSSLTPGEIAFITRLLMEDTPADEARRWIDRILPYLSARALGVLAEIFPTAGLSVERFEGLHTEVGFVRDLAERRRAREITSHGAASLPSGGPRSGG